MDDANYHDALSSAWTETAAAIELIQMKNQQPTNLECRAASKLLAGMMHTNESSFASPVHHHANEEEGATGTSPAAVIPFNNSLSTLPFAIADMSRDDQFLSPLQVYLRRHCTEYFSATAENAFARGRQSSVEEGRVGVRCVFCKHLPRGQQASQATAYPNKIDKICSSVVMIQCRHFPNCQEIPDSVRDQLAALKRAGNANAASCSGTKRLEYWTDSAHQLGFVDTAGGIRFVSRDNMDTDSEDDLVLASTIGNGVKSSIQVIGRPNLVTPVEEPIISSLESINYELLVRGSSLVTMDERNLVPDYIFLAIAQLTRCRLANDDRVGSFKHYDVGYVGLCCRHCQGSRPGAGNGKFFPNSQRSLAQTTTTQSIVKHLTEKCGHVPRSIKDTISRLAKKSEEVARRYAKKNSHDEGPKFGGRKAFFKQIWDKLHESDDTAFSTPNITYDFGTNSFVQPAENVFRPTPIRMAPASLSYTSQVNKSCKLFDHRNRRVTVRFPSCNVATNKGIKKKRSSSFPAMAGSKKKKSKI